VKVVIKKTRVPGLRTVSENRMVLWLLFLTQSKRVTDSQTDGRTDRYATYAYVAL